MRYKVIKNINLDKKADQFVNTSAQCMLKLLFNRLNESENRDYPVDEEFDINFDFSMYDDEIRQMKEEMGYSNDKFINSADSFVRKL